MVIHGTADPMFPVEQGKALAEEIPGGRLLLLEAAGHGVYRADWKRIAGGGAAERRCSTRQLATSVRRTLALRVADTLGLGVDIWIVVLDR